MKARIVGTGVAGLTCAHLLCSQGWDIELTVMPSGPAPPLVLNELTAALLVDLWGDPGELFATAHRLTARQVRWGAHAEERTVPGAALAVTGERLVATLLELLRTHHGNAVRFASPAAFTSSPKPSDEWVIEAGGRQLATAQRSRRSYGRRCVISVEAALGYTTTATSFVESLNEGWVHVAPLDSTRALVQAMIAAPPRTSPTAMLQELLAATRSAKNVIDEFLSPAAVFPAAPAMRDPVCEPGWIAVGDAALSFDPLSGSGTGHALRGAILASAVVHGTASGLPLDRCLAHYTWRLRRAAVDHLTHCARFYAAAFFSPEWKTEIELMERAAAELQASRATHAGAGYLLRGLVLEPQPS
jgi:2-polyprenyl-6-methoxyphenol hydroxylase-like FAD-dependent oxidoreductase